MLNNRWCPNLFLFWCTVHFTQSSKRNTVFSCVMSGMSCVCTWMLLKRRRDEKRDFKNEVLASVFSGWAGLGSTAGSSGGSLEGVWCVLGCGASAGCRSGWECGCSAGGHKDSVRIRSPGRWVLEEHSLSVLRKKGGEGWAARFLSESLNHL